MGTPALPIGQALSWSFLKAVIASWFNDRCLSMGAAIAYYAAFSLAPLLLLVIAIAALVFGREAAQGAIVGQLGALIGPEGAAALEALIENASRSGSGWLANIVGVGALLLAATGAVGEIQSSLNVIWKAAPSKESTLRAFLRRKLLSYSFVVVMGFLLMTSLVVSAALAAAGDHLAAYVPSLDVILQIVNFIVSLAVVTAIFATVYKILPDAPIAWRDVWLGAGAAGLLFTVGKILIGAYIGSSAIASTYGAAAALVIILLWVYYTSQILLFGAELAHEHAEGRPAKTSPDRAGNTQ
jgi:membrane protein